ncbi:MAG: hypothetical protein R3C45_12690 [Phycisphaerales bacterium]
MTDKSDNGTLDQMRSVVAEHLDPRWGSAFWLDRAEQAGVRTAEEITGLSDLVSRLSMGPADLRARPLLHYVPRRYHDQRHRFVIGQTGGTTGPGAWTVYLPVEFHEAFVEPFTRAATHTGFPEGETWLYVGPTGPHLIGKAASAIARCVGSCEPFFLDFDPRWSRKMPAESAGATRYLQHVLDQAMDVIEQQRIGVLFATPPVLMGLAKRMTPKQREQVRGVHYGGMAINAATLEELQVRAFPVAVHLSGYGNTLFGCCPELRTTERRHHDYYPFGTRLRIEVVDEKGRPASVGRVRFTRLDHGSMIVGMLERDHAQVAQLPAHAPAGFVLPGVRDPHTPATAHQPAVATLY